MKDDGYVSWASEAPKLEFYPRKWENQQPKVLEGQAVETPIMRPNPNEKKGARRDEFKEWATSVHTPA